MLALLAPMTPHISAELWERRRGGHVHAERWPEADPDQVRQDLVTLVVQVNGKVRDRIQVPADLPEDELVARATDSPKVQAQLNGAEIRKTIVVPRKLVNLVVG